MKSHDAMVKTWVNNSASGELSSIHGYGVMSFYSVYIYIYIHIQYIPNITMVWCSICGIYPIF